MCTDEEMSVYGDLSCTDEEMSVYGDLSCTDVEVSVYVDTDRAAIVGLCTVEK